MNLLIKINQFIININFYVLNLFKININFKELN